METKRNISYNCSPRKQKNRLLKFNMNLKNRLDDIGRTHDVL